MTQNIIDVSWDLPKFDAQTQAVLENMSKVYELANLSKSNGIKPGSDGGYTELIKNNTAFNKVQESTLRLTKLQEQAEQARLRTQKLTQDAILAEAKARKANADAAIAEARAKEQAAKNTPNTVINGGSRDVDESYNNSGGVAFSQERKAAQDEEVASIQEASAAQKEYQATLSGSNTVTQDAVGSSKELEAAKLALVKANSEENEAIQGYKVQTQAANKAAKEQAMITHEMLSPYQLLNKQYLEAQANAKDLAVQYGVESTEAKQAAAAALELNVQLQTIDKSVGLSQRNVGNYGSALNGAGKAIHNFTNLSSLAGTAINRFRRIFVGFFVTTLASNFIFPVIQLVTDFIEKLVDMNKTSEETLKLQQDIADAYKSAADGAASEISKVTVLKEVLESENTTRLQKVAALKELKEENVDYFGQLDIENGKVNGLSNAYDVYIAKLIRSINAKANVEQLTTALKAQNEVIGEINKTNADSQKHTLANLTEYERRTAIADFNLNFGDKNKSKVISPEQDQLIVDLLNKRDLVKKITDNMKGDIQDAFDPKPEKGGAKNKVAMDSTKDQLDLEFELYKIAQQRKIKLLDEGQNDTKKDFQERLIMAGEYTKAVIELSDRTYQHEIANDNAKLEVLRKNYAKSKGTEKNNIAVEIENTTKMILIAQSKQNSARLSMEDDFQKEQLSIRKDEADKELKAFEAAEKAANNVRTENQGAIDAQRAMEKAAHDELLHDKIITQKQYDKAEKKSINDSLLLSLNADLKKEESLRALAILQHQSTVDIDNAINETKAKIISAKNQAPDDKDKNKNRDYEIQAAKAAQDAIAGLVDIGYQKELTAIQKIIDLNNYRKDQEIANINASTLSNQEKAAQMIVLDNTVAANNKKLEREKVAIQIKQAKFDRDMAILGVVENAAVAEFTPPYSPWKAAAIAIEAAASIAMILAKPLPSMPAYAEGTENHPGGPAIVGEGKYKELVEEAGGKSFIASRPMLLNNLPKGSKVTPLTTEMIMAGMEQSANMSMAERIVFSNKIQAEGNRVELSAIKDAVYETGRMTAQAIRKQRGANVNVYVDSSWNAYISKVVKE